MLWRFVVRARPITLNRYYGGTHWAKRRKESQQWHLLALAAIRDASPVPRLERAHIGYVVAFPSWRSIPDASNVFVKVIEDTMVSEGVVPDDNPRHVLSHHVSVVVDGSVSEPEIRVFVGDTAVGVVTAMERERPGR